MRTTTPIRTIAAAAAIGLVLTACGQKPEIAHIDAGVGGGSDLAGGGGGGFGDDGGLGSTDSGGFDGGTDTGGLDGGTDAGGFDTGGDTGGFVDGGDATGGDTSGGAAGGDTSGGAAGGDTSGGSTGGSTGGSAGGSTGGTSGGSTGGSTGGTSGGSTGGTSGGTSGGSTGGKRATRGTNTTGTTADKITLAIHAPATGAAPLPVTSFEKARNTYWQHVTDGGKKVLGRSNVEVLFQDDKYAPDSAIQVCQELASKAFLLVGGGGTDQIQACGVFANQKKVPYFSAGVTENKLSDNPWYFAASMTYRQQGALLAQYVKKNPNKVARLGPGAKIGTIITNTPNFDDALDGWLKGLAANGLQNIDTFKHTKGDKAWYADTAQRFQGQGIDVIYFLSAPVDYINFAKTANQRFGYNPQYIGVGISKAINAVLGSGCGDPGKLIDDGIFLHPYPGVDKAPADFVAASKKFGAPADDIALALWGLNKAQHQLFVKYEEVFGTKLTREDFRDLVEGGAGTISTGVYPDLNYSPGNHLGAKAAWVLQADCGSKTHKTLTSKAVSGF